MPPQELERQTRRQRINPRFKAAGWKLRSFDPAMPLSAYGPAAVEELKPPTISLTMPYVCTIQRMAINLFGGEGTLTIGRRGYKERVSGPKEV